MMVVLGSEGPEEVKQSMSRRATALQGASSIESLLGILVATPCLRLALCT